MLKPGGASYQGSEEGNRTRWESARGWRAPAGGHKTHEAKSSAQWRQLEQMFDTVETHRAGTSVVGRARPGQSPVAAECSAARVASRTKRATLRAQERMSPQMEALALLARPNQGERLMSRRAWLALRLSA